MEAWAPPAEQAPAPPAGAQVKLEVQPAAVGKTALATQFACGSFPERCEPSVEELFSKVIEVNAAPALLEIVDTVGAAHLVTLTDLYIRNSDGFVVLYSVCSEASFEAVRPLRERMRRLRGPRAAYGSLLQLSGGRTRLLMSEYPNQAAGRTGWDSEEG
ncbi:ras-related protein Rap-2b-like [Crocuta crocuta]